MCVCVCCFFLCFHLGWLRSSPTATPSSAQRYRTPALMVVTGPCALVHATRFAVRRVHEGRSRAVRRACLLQRKQHSVVTLLHSTLWPVFMPWREWISRRASQPAWETIDGMEALTKALRRPVRASGTKPLRSSRAEKGQATRLPGIGPAA